jgi:hypothetical protein
VSGSRRHPPKGGLLATTRRVLLVSGLRRPQQKMLFLDFAAGSQRRGSGLLFVTPPDPLLRIRGGRKTVKELPLVFTDQEGEEAQQRPLPSLRGHPGAVVAARGNPENKHPAPSLRGARAIIGEPRGNPENKPCHRFEGVAVAGAGMDRLPRYFGGS